MDRFHRPASPFASIASMGGVNGRSIISFRDVHKYFGSNHVLRGITLDVGVGEVVVIAGPSGSGKSTLIRCINKLETISSGQLEVDGVQVDSRSANVNKLRTEIGMVFQQFNLF